MKRWNKNLSPRDEKMEKGEKEGKVRDEAGVRKGETK